MRVTKFRCKIKGDAGIYPVWAIDWETQVLRVERACGFESVPIAKIQILLQYTGRKDITNVEVYDSDVLSDDGGTTAFTVFWGDEQGCWLVKYDEDTMTLADALCLPSKVIGNVHAGLLEAR